MVFWLKLRIRTICTDCFKKLNLKNKQLLCNKINNSVICVCWGQESSQISQVPLREFCYSNSLPIACNENQKNTTYSDKGDERKRPTIKAKFKVGLTCRKGHRVWSWKSLGCEFVTASKLHLLAAWEANNWETCWGKQQLFSESQASNKIMK